MSISGRPGLRALHGKLISPPQGFTEDNGHREKPGDLPEVPPPGRVRAGSGPQSGCL